MSFQAPRRATSRVLLAAFAFVGLAPLSLFAFGCDALKHDGQDAAVVVVVPPTPATAAAPATADPPPTVATAAPLGAAAPVAPGGAAVRPAGDAGKAVAKDGGAVADAGKAAPVPTPTFAIPTAIPGFDASAFKPPAGFPTTLPTFPPPAKN